jgi:predicted secreted protein
VTKRRDLLIAIIVTFCLAVVLFAAIPTWSSPGAGDYNPWYDVNDDGSIDGSDLIVLCRAFGSTGQPITKASIQYDSGWMNITDKCGQNIVMTHNLNSTDLIVDIQGKTSLSSGPHQRNYGLTGEMQGWNETYGGASYDTARSVVRTSDGGYALTGSTGSFGVGGTDFWLVKTDPAGNAQWNKTYGGTGLSLDDAYALVQTSDGGYALAGMRNYDFWLVKTDSSGNAQWNKTYVGSYNGVAYALVQTSDGGYALAGYTNSFGAGDFDFWLVKTDSSGNAQWNKTYGGLYEDVAYALVQTGDGGYALAGWRDALGAANYDFWLVKTDSSGNAQWNKTYGGTSVDCAYALVQTSGGGYALVGITNSFGAGSWDFWLVKADSLGNAQWNKTYGGTTDDYANDLVQTSDGGYVLTGETGSFGAGGGDSWLVKTDSAGNMMWNKTYGGINTDGAYALVQTGDGGYALAGYTRSYGAGNSDFWLVKTDANGNIGGFESGLAWIDSTADTISLYRGATDIYWNFVRVRLWKPR